MTHLSPDVSTHELLQTGLSPEDRSAVGMFEELRSKRRTKGKLSPDETSLLTNLTSDVQRLHERLMSTVES